MEKGNQGFYGQPPPNDMAGIGFGEPAPPYTPMPLPGQQVPQIYPGFGPAAGQPYAAAGQPYAPAPPNAPMVQVVQLTNLRGESTRMTCPHCRADISTRVRYETGRMTHLAALLLCLVFCWPCALIPYCSEGCMDAEHECPNCNKFIGSYRR